MRPQLTPSLTEIETAELQVKIFRKVAAERARQEEIHGENSILGKDPLGFENFAILGEEVGEVGKALLECSFDPNFPETSREELKIELVQVAAVAVAWLEALEETEE